MVNISSSPLRNTGRHAKEPRVYAEDSLSNRLLSYVNALGPDAEPTYDEIRQESQFHGANRLTVYTSLNTLKRAGLIGGGIKSAKKIGQEEVAAVEYDGESQSSTLPVPYSGRRSELVIPADLYDEPIDYLKDVAGDLQPYPESAGDGHVSGRVVEAAVFKPSRAGISDEAQIGKNKDALLQRYRDFDTGDFTNWWDWWSSLRETQTPEGAAIRYMERALEKLSGKDRRFVSCYLSQILCNPNTYDSRRKTYMPGNPDFRRAAILSDVVKISLKDGSVPDEIYASMQVLNPVDNRTTYIWGESLRDKGLELLRDIGMQKDPESACRVAKERYKIFLGYDA